MIRGKIYFNHLQQTETSNNLISECAIRHILIFIIKYCLQIVDVEKIVNRKLLLTSRPLPKKKNVDTTQVVKYPHGCQPTW